MRGTIPRLRAAGYCVERSPRPLSRGTRFRVFRWPDNSPDDTAAIVYSRRELDAWTAYFLDGEEKPESKILEPTGRRSAAVRPRCFYL